MRLGEWGEKEAVKYLKKLGFTIVKTNYSCRLGEVDIIVFHNNTFRFIEVKTRQNDSYGSPIDSITPKKIKHIIRVAKYYLLENGINEHHVDITLDAIEVYAENGQTKFNYIEDILS